MFFMAEYANMITVSCLATILFFGGWLSPFPGIVGPGSNIFPRVGLLLAALSRVRHGAICAASRASSLPSSRCLRLASALLCLLPAVIAGDSGAVLVLTKVWLVHVFLCLDARDAAALAL